MTNPTKKLQALGQSLWLDNMTREMLQDGTLQGYIRELSVTGLTSNPTIFDLAIKSGAYDDSIHTKSSAGVSGEALFFELAGEDLTAAADLFRPIHRATNHLDGWVSLEVSPLLAHDTPRTIEQVKSLHQQLARPNLFIKIPGTPEGLPAIEEAIFKGIPINVTLLFSPEQYLAAARAFQRGIERRIEKGLDPDVVSVASVFISRWDKAVQKQVPAELGTSSATRSRAKPIGSIGSCSILTTPSAWPMRVPGISGCSGPAPAPRTLKHRTFSI